MKKLAWAFALIISVFAFFSLSGCVQAPTEKQSISDLRPQISFKVSDERLLPARVQLDGLDAGQVSDYIDEVSSMRIRPGTHIVRVTFNNTVLLEEKFYLGDGVNRSFVIR